jgi:hypothetical protein
LSPALAFVVDSRFKFISTTAYDIALQHHRNEEISPDITHEAFLWNLSYWRGDIPEPHFRVPLALGDMSRHISGGLMFVWRTFPAQHLLLQILHLHPSAHRAITERGRQGRDVTLCRSLINRIDLLILVLHKTYFFVPGFNSLFYLPHKPWITETLMKAGITEFMIPDLTPSAPALGKQFHLSA